MMSRKNRFAQRSGLVATVIFLLTAAGWTPEGRGAVLLAEYSFEGTNSGDFTASTDSDPNSFAGSFADGSAMRCSLLASPSSGSFVSSAFKPYSAIPTLDSAGELAFFSFTVAPGSGYLLDLAELVLDVQRDKVTPATGAKSYVELRSDAQGDDFQTAIFTSTLESNSGDFVVDQTALLTSPAFQDLDAATEFRFYIFDEGNASPDLGVHIDNVQLWGETSAAEVSVNPEPSSLLTWGGLIGIGTVAVWRRRRKR